MKKILVSLMLLAGCCTPGQFSDRKYQLGDCATLTEEALKESPQAKGTQLYVFGYIQKGYSLAIVFPNGAVVGPVNMATKEVETKSEKVECSELTKSIFADEPVEDIK